VVAGAHPSRLRVVGAVVSLPIVLPPTVLGFYLLVVMGPEGVGC
jgi:molybdate transport system permease protein